MWVEALARGELPVWDPYLQTGVPYLSDPTNAVFYPLNLLLLTAPLTLAAKLYVALHFAIALLGTWWCARRYGCSPRAALLAAVCFGFGGYLVCTANTLVKLRALAWLPWLFGAWRLALERPRRLGPVAAAGALLGLLVVCGHIYAAYLSGLLLGAEALMRGCGGGKSRGRALAVACAIVGLGAGLSAVQWLPSYAFMRHSERRASLDDVHALRWSLQPHGLLDLAVPGPRGTPEDPPEAWSESLYFGLLPLLLAVLAVARRVRHALWLGGVGVLATVLAFGAATPLFPLVQSALPLLDRFRYPEKLMLWLVFFASLLAGLGADRLFPARGGFRWREAGAALLGLGLGAVLLPAPGLDGFAWFRPLVLLGLFGLILLSRRRVWALALLVGVCVADLEAVNGRWLPGLPEEILSMRPRLLDDLPPPALERWRLGRQPHRNVLGGTPPRPGLRGGYENAHETFVPNLGVLHGIAHVHAECTVQLWRHARLLEAVPPDTSFMLLGAHFVLTQRRDRSLARRGWERVAVLPAHGVELFAHPSPLPRVALFERALHVPDDVAAAAALRAVDLAATLVVETTGAEEVEETGEEGTGSARIVSYEPAAVEVAVESPRPAWLVLFDAHLPGWRAEDEEGSLPIFYGDLLFRAVRVRPGSSTVRFRYEPEGFRLGALLSLGTLLALGLAGVLAVRPRRR